MITFYKYQGTGNDFILLDDRRRNFPSQNTGLIEKLCNRRFGIGADGLILLQENEAGQFYMQYFNSDGRESSMCGNGGRCLAKFIFDLGLAKESISFMAIDGLHEAHLELSKKGEEVIALKMIPVHEVMQLEPETFVLNTGSPHYVQFREDAVTDIDLINEAKKVRYNPTYKETGINVNYLNLIGLKELLLRTYERGVEDETFSCGTGATAAALASAIFINLPSGTHTIQVNVMGGNLEVKFHFTPGINKFEDVWLIGPAKRVFTGEIIV